MQYWNLKATLHMNNWMICYLLLHLARTCFALYKNLQSKYFHIFCLVKLWQQEGQRTIGESTFYGQAWRLYFPVWKYFLVGLKVIFSWIKISLSAGLMVFFSCIKVFFIGRLEGYLLLYKSIFIGRWGLKVIFSCVKL